MFKKTQNLEGLYDRESRSIPFLNNVPAFRLYCFFVERNPMDSSYMLWNKFQDYQLRFILTNRFLVTA